MLVLLVPFLKGGKHVPLVLPILWQLLVRLLVNIAGLEVFRLMTFLSVFLIQEELKEIPIP